MGKTIADLIQERRGQLTKLERDAELLRAELRGLELALAASGQGIGKGSFQTPRPPRAPSTPGTRGRQRGAISKSWRAVLTETLRRNTAGNRGITDDELTELARQHISSGTRPAEARRRYRDYAEWGFVRQELDGWWVESLAVDRFGLNAEGPAEAGPSQEIGGGVVRAQVFPAERPGGPIPPTSTSQADDDEIASIIGQPSGARPAQSGE